MGTKNFSSIDLHVARVMLGIPWQEISLVRVARECSSALGVPMPESRAQMKSLVSLYLKQNPSSAATARDGLASRKKVREAKDAKKEKRKRKERVRREPIGKPHPDYKRDDRFYTSREWKELRYKALKMYGATCQCCGARACDGAQIHVDHVHPIYKRPDLKLSIENLQVMCADCNIGKGAWDETDWRQHWKSI